MLLKAQQREDDIRHAQKQLTSGTKLTAEEKRKKGLYQATPIILGNPILGNPNPVTINPNRPSQRAFSPGRDGDRNSADENRIYETRTTLQRARSPQGRPLDSAQGGRTSVYASHQQHQRALSPQGRTSRHQQHQHQQQQHRVVSPQNSFDRGQTSPRAALAADPTYAGHQQFNRVPSSNYAQTNHYNSAAAIASTAGYGSSNSSVYSSTGQLVSNSGGVGYRGSAVPEPQPQLGRNSRGGLAPIPQAE